MLLHSRLCRFLVLTVLISNAVAPAAHAGARYYMMIFAAEGTPNLPHLAHTFATFIKVEDRKKGAATEAPIAVHTISWLPATHDVRLLVPPEKGANLDLQATLEFEKSLNAHVSAWGPFEIRKELFDRALAQIKRLDSGAIAYKAADRRFRLNGASNCFHAVSDIAEGPLLETGTAFGEPASRMVLQHLTRWIIEPTKIHREVIERMDLKSYAISYRDDGPLAAQNLDARR